MTEKKSTEQETVEQTKLLQFPCDFPIKIIGLNTANFISDIISIARKHYPDIDTGILKHNASDKGNYTAITLTVRALDQNSLDALYQDINRHPNIKMVL